jgi:predicted metal-dependent phosphoesterase TrpH
MRFADLHIHTHHSDGLRSPRQVVELAAAHQLAIIAISDHDNLAAIDEGTDFARERGIQLIAAIELSIEYRGVDLHLLAYGVDPLHRGLQQHLEHFRRGRIERGVRMVERLVAGGCPIRHDRVMELCGQGSLGRPHIARALVEAGVCGSIQQAFEQWLSPGCPGYVEKERFEAGAAIRLVREAGGLTSIAHPTLYPDFRQVTLDLFALGVDAVEAIHPEVDPAARADLQELARSHGKFLTGGSDDHGFEDLRTIGRVRVAEVLIEPLLSHLRARA